METNKRIAMVYPKERYNEGNSPYTIYIPSKDIMFKLMRACIHAEDPTDLWFWNHKKDRIWRRGSYYDSGDLIPAKVEK